MIRGKWLDCSSGLQAGLKLVPELGFFVSNSFNEVHEG